MKKKKKKEEKNLLWPSIRVIISGGGTGGHIFPAIAIANELMSMNQENEILFVGALGRMEMEKVPAAGYKIIGLNISGIQRRLSVSNLMLPVKVLKSIMRAKQILNSFKPDLVVGVGGYASGPLLFAATWMNIPTLIQEQNSYAGITNKLLAKRVNRICVAYPGMEKYFPSQKIVLTGNPVRQDILEGKGKRDEAMQFFGLNPDKKTVLVIGGSLGAKTINLSIQAALNRFSENNIQLIWQTGKLFFQHAEGLSKEMESKGIRMFDFIRRMDLAYAAADVVISRAGASSVSELALIAKPAILVPSPNVAEDHQTRNAMSLVDRNAAILVSDRESSEKLVDTTFALINNVQEQKDLSERISKFAFLNSSSRIAEEGYKLTTKLIESNQRA